jgi:hypothetical protein
MRLLFGSRRERLRIHVPGQAAARADDPVLPEEPIPEPAQAIREKADADEKGQVGGALEIGNPVTLIPASRAPVNVGVELDPGRDGCTAGGAPIGARFEILSAS